MDVEVRLRWKKTICTQILQPKTDPDFRSRVKASYHDRLPDSDWLFISINEAHFQPTTTKHQLAVFLKSPPNQRLKKKPTNLVPHHLIIEHQKELWEIGMNKPYLSERLRSSV